MGVGNAIIISECSDVSVGLPNSSVQRVRLPLSTFKHIVNARFSCEKEATSAGVPSFELLSTIQTFHDSPLGQSDRSKASNSSRKFSERLQVATTIDMSTARTCRSCIHGRGCPAFASAVAVSTDSRRLRSDDSIAGVAIKEFSVRCSAVSQLK